jgi:hypothetical protein
MKHFELLSRRKRRVQLHVTYSGRNWKPRQTPQRSPQNPFLYPSLFEFGEGSDNDLERHHGNHAISKNSVYFVPLTGFRLPATGLQDPLPIHNITQSIKVGGVFIIFLTLLSSSAAQSSALSIDNSQVAKRSPCPISQPFAGES